MAGDDAARPDAGSTYDVFISYASADRAWVDATLLPALEGAGLRVSIDYRDFEIGVPILNNIERAVEVSRHTLVVLSPQWLTSTWADFESVLVGTRDPAARKRKLIPIVLAACPPPSRIAALTYADFTSPESQRREMPRLIRALGGERKRIFISYKRNVDPDQLIATQVREALSQRHEVFIDQTMLVGTEWAARIEAELRRADYLVTLLSEQAAHSEMVQAEISTAHRLAQEQGGKPAILPVRLAYQEPYEYPLSAYLNPIQWASWIDPTHTPRLIAELLEAVAGGTLSNSGPPSGTKASPASEPQSIPQPRPAAQPLPLELPEGTMDSESRFYVVRSSDASARGAIQQRGVTITIKGPRQMGKSSLLMRVMADAGNAGKRVIFLDFQLLDRATLTHADVFFRRFCAWITDELELESKLDEYWDPALGNPQRSTRYMGRYVLKQAGTSVVLAMDEVESIFATDFRDDFFGMLRNWHNNRGNVTTPIWKNLDLALITSTEPYQLIGNLNQSPFNVGVVAELSDFTQEQVGDLNARHGSPLSGEDERRLVDLIGGHPYLVRRALYLVATGQAGIADLFTRAGDDQGPFGDHLRHHLFRLHDQPELRQGLLQVIRYHTCEDERIVFRLRGAGLVRRDDRAVVPRCKLYAEYFGAHLESGNRGG
jgi:hypothetical protein